MLISFKRALCFLIIFYRPEYLLSFDFSEAIVNDETTLVYWFLQDGFSPHTLISSGMLPLESSYLHDQDELTELLQYYCENISPSEISIEYATNHDAEMIATVHYYSWNDTYGRGLSSKTLEERVEFWKRNLNDPPAGYRVLILKINGRIVAFCGYTESQNAIELNSFYVHPAFQRMGLGSRLINELINKVKTSTTRIYLWVYEFNSKAINFYVKNGFKKTKNRLIDYQNMNEKLLKFEISF